MTEDVRLVAAAVLVGAVLAPLAAAGLAAVNRVLAALRRRVPCPAGCPACGVDL